MTSTSNTIFARRTNDFPKSRIRRKPTFTYKSPSASDVDPFICSLHHGSNASSNSASTESNDTRTALGSQRSNREKPQAGSYSLPLYHPMGELALSLPPLDPTDLGLPNSSDGSSRKVSGRSRQLFAKTHDAYNEQRESPVPTVSSIAAVAAHEVKRGSPRKKRMGGANGKRRRRDADDGDATYPAKRTRQTRVGGGDDNDLEDTGQGDGDGTPEIDGPVEQRSERRSTRSRVKHRDSSEAESLADNHPTQDPVSATEDNTKRPAPESIREHRGDGKEGGELEEGKGG